MSAEYCAIKPNKWKELANQTNDDVVIQRYAITGKEDLSEVYDDLETILDSVTTDGELDIVKLNGYNITHQTGHFIMKIKDVKGNEKRKLVINPIPTFFCPIGGENITYEKIDNNPYVRIIEKTDGKSGKKYYYAEFAGYNTIENLRESLANDDLVNDGFTVDDYDSLDESIIKERSDSLELKTKLFKEKFDDKVAEEVNIEESSDIQGKDKSKLEYLFGESVTKINDLKNKYKTDIAKLRADLKNAKSDSQKTYILDRISELENDILNLNNLLTSLKNQEIYGLSEYLASFSKMIELSSSKVDTIIRQVYKTTDRIASSLGKQKGKSIKAIDYVLNNEDGINPSAQLSILSRQQHLLEFYTNLIEIEKAISILKENIEKENTKYSSNTEASLYLKDLSDILNVMEEKIDSIKKSKKNVESVLNHVIKETVIAIFASQDYTAKARWKSLVYSRLKEEAEKQYYKDLETMSEKKAKEKYNKVVEDHKLWKEADLKSREETEEKIRFIFKHAEQELTEVEDITKVNAFISQQGRIQDTATQIVLNYFSLIEQKTRTQYMEDMNSKDGFKGIEDALKDSGLDLSNIKSIVEEREYTDLDDKKHKYYVIKPIFKSEFIEKYNDLFNQVKLLQSKLEEEYSNNEDILKIQAEIDYIEKTISTIKSIINKTDNLNEQSKYLEKIESLKEKSRNLNVRLELEKSKINKETVKQIESLKEEIEKNKKRLIEASKAIEKYYENPSANDFNKFKDIIDIDLIKDHKMFKAIFLITKAFFNLEKNMPYDLQNLTHRGKIYNIIEQDEEFGGNKIVKIEKDDTVNILMDEIILPKIESSKIELAKRGKIKDVKEQMLFNFYKIQESDKANGFSIVYDVDINGNPVKRIRRNFFEFLAPEMTQSFDLLNLFSLESIATHSYINKEKLQNELETITEVINKRDVVEKQGIKKVFSQTRFGRFKIPLLKSKSDKPNVVKVIEAMMDYHLYGQKMKSTGFEKLDNFLYRITGFSALTGYVGNPFSAAANILSGSAQNMMEVFGQEFFSYKDARIATFLTPKYLKDYYSTSFKLQDDSFLSVLFREFDLQGMSSNRFNFNTKYESKAQELLLNPLSLIGKINSETEFMTQAPIVIAILQGIKVVDENGNYLDKDGKIVKDKDDAQSLLDIMYVKNGKIEFKKKLEDLYLSQVSNSHNKGSKVDSLIWSGNSEDVLKNTIKRFVEDILFKKQGMYNPMFSPLAKMNPLLAPLFQYRSFMDEFLRDGWGGITTAIRDINDPERHGGSYVNPATGKPDQGFIISMFSLWLMRPGTFTKIIKNPVIKILNSFRDVNDKIKQEITNVAAYNQLTDKQQANVKRFCYYSALNSSLFFATLILSSLKDSGDYDEDSLDLINLLARRMRNEIMFIWNPNEFVQLFSNPAAAISTIEKVSSLANTAFFTAMELAINGEVIKGRYQIGEHKGDLKLYHKALDVVPYASFISVFKDKNYVQDRLKFYEKTY